MKVFMLLCGAFFFGVVVSNAFENIANKEAVSVKRQVVPVLKAALERDKDISLQDIGGVSWDLVCFATYQARGIDVADASWIAEQALAKEGLSFANYQIADENYNEFRGNNYGLVFISHARQLIVGTVFESGVYIDARQASCVPAAEAVLKYKSEKPKNINSAVVRYFSLMRQETARLKEEE